jgi:hypothetical protein
MPRRNERIVAGQSDSQITPSRETITGDKRERGQTDFSKNFPEKFVGGIELRLVIECTRIRVGIE